MTTPLKPASPDKSSRTIHLDGGEMHLHSDVLSAPDSQALYETLQASAPWQQARIKLFGRDVASPRLSAWFGTSPYTYSNLTWPARPWPADLARIRTIAEALAETRFNGVLVNLYRDGRDGMGWHSDDERELGPEPVIASYTLGASRRFIMRHKGNKSEKIELALPHGSLLVMRGATQRYWQHAVPKTKKPVAPRINLTFRRLFDD